MKKRLKSSFTRCKGENPWALMLWITLASAQNTDDSMWCYRALRRFFCSPNAFMTQFVILFSHIELALARQPRAHSNSFVRSFIHWFNYFGNHSVVVFINAFIGLCGALRNDFLLFVAYSCSEVWNWLFFRVNKSDIRVKWAFRFYLLHSLLFPLSPCASMRRNSSQSQLRLHWERQCHLSNFDTDGGASGKNPFRNETEKKAQMNFQSMYRTAYFLFNLKWTIAIGNINWEKKNESQNHFVGFSIWICICGT